jgi:hypothetical protein
MTSTHKYAGIIGPLNVFQNECSQIVENIRKCTTTKQNTVCDFNEKRQQFLLLNIHCEPELQTLSRELANTKTAFDYKIIYNTQQPYQIRYDKTQNKVSISQHTFL